MRRPDAWVGGMTVDAFPVVSRNWPISCVRPSFFLPSVSHTATRRLPQPWAQYASGRARRRRSAGSCTGDARAGAWARAPTERGRAGSAVPDAGVGSVKLPPGRIRCKRGESADASSWAANRALDRTPRDVQSLSATAHLDSDVRDVAQLRSGCAQLAARRRGVHGPCDEARRLHEAGRLHAAAAPPGCRSPCGRRLARQVHWDGRWPWAARSARRVRGAPPATEPKAGNRARRQELAHVDHRRKRPMGRERDAQGQGDAVR